MKKNNYKILLSFFMPFFIFGQNFSYQSKIDKPEKTGFTKILISPEIKSILEEDDFSSLRIFNAKNKEIPYFISKEMSSFPSENFQELKLISSIILKNKSSEYIIENTNKENLSSLIIEISNTADKKQYTISGSNDQKNWFSLNSDQELEDLQNDTNNTIIKQINFPRSNYLFYTIVFKDKNTNPLHVLRFGTIKKNIPKSDFIELPIKFAQKNNVKKQTEIKINLPYDSTIDKISFNISNPRLFSRDAKIVKDVERTYKNKKWIEQETISNFILESSTKNSFIIDNVKTKEFKIIIDNLDNSPLEISSIKLFQIPVYLISDLESDQNYILKFKNPNLKKPSYDLENFKNSISGNLNILKTKEIIKSNQKENKIEQAFYQSSWFLWLCIGIGALTLLFFSFQMLKDLKNTK